MLNNDYMFFVVYGVLIISILYLTIRELFGKDKEMYYEVLESNIELIEALENQNKEINELLQYNKGNRYSKTRKESQETREESTLFV